MEIKLNTNKIDPIVSHQVGQQKSRETAPAKDGAAFEHTDALNRVFQATSDVRPDKVDLGRTLASDVQYPPPEIIKRIANLLALKMNGPSESPDATV